MIQNEDVMQFFSSIYNLFEKLDEINYNFNLPVLRLVLVSVLKFFYG